MGPCRPERGYHTRPALAGPELREGVKASAGASERDIQTLVTGSRLWWSDPDLGAGVLESAFTASEAAAAPLGFRRSAAEVHPAAPGGRAIVHERLGRPRRAIPRLADPEVAPVQFLPIQFFDG